MRGNDRMGREIVKYCLWSGTFAAGLGLFCSGPQALYAQFNGPALTLPAEAPAVLSPTNDPALLESNVKDYRLSTGDVLTVHIFDEPDYIPTVKVNADGTVTLPLIGQVPLDGLTPEEASHAIAVQLETKGFYLDPQVNIDLVAAVNQYATITGEIHAIVPLLGVRRLFDVLASTGTPISGASPNASLASPSIAGTGWPALASHTITIVRAGEAKPIVVNIGTDPTKIAAANIVIKPHDLIVVSKVGVVYVVGAFAKQGAIPLDQNTPLTLLEATALTGGENFEGKYKDLRIIRSNGLTRTVTTVNIKRIEKGLDPDPILQADDILFLPTVLWKAALKSGGIQTLTTIADAAILGFEVAR